ncbi:MAG: hypothetical protein FJ211_00995 [Ignavibacteria bacterium]|nr:hypothetical protein [Ignavibacteria bacterium]
MRVVKAFAALRDGVVAPQRIENVTIEAAMAVFAIAVFLVAITTVWSVDLQQGNSQLAAESARLISSTTTQRVTEVPQVDLSLPQRVFTQALGEALQKTIIPYVALAALAMTLFRFTTNVKVRYLESLAAISATALIDVFGIIVATMVHLMLGTMRAGFHAGVFVDPQIHPMWFVWLQTFSVASLWQLMAACVGLASWNSLNWRYGIVVGAILWLVSRLILGGFSLMDWIVVLRTQ